jgi:uncharacterized membrane protein YtjA (UPF0391 family)
MVLRVTSSPAIKEERIVVFPFQQWLPAQASASRNAYIAKIFMTKFFCTFLISLAYCTHRPSPFPFFHRPFNTAEARVIFSIFLYLILV